MKYERFEDLPVWQSAMELAERVYRLTRGSLFAGPGDLRDQLRRAALSVSNNIAEGFERGSTAELLMFLYIARGSAGEVRSMLRFAARLCSAAKEPAGTSGTSNLKSQISDSKSETTHLKSEISNPKWEISDLKSEIAAMIALAESCSRQIRGWADSLQNSEIKGPRHLTERSRSVQDQQRRAEACRRRMEQTFRDAHPELFPPADPRPE